MSTFILQVQNQTRGRFFCLVFSLILYQQANDKPIALWYNPMQILKERSLDHDCAVPEETGKPEA